MSLLAGLRFGQSVRPALLAAVLGCGLVVGCSEAPKLAKAPEAQPPVSDQAKREAAPPIGERSPGAGPGAQSESSQSAGGGAAPPPTTEQPRLGEAPEKPSAPQYRDETDRSVAPDTSKDAERAGTAEPPQAEAPSGGAAPPDDFNAPPPASLGQGAPAPSAEPPPPVATAPGEPPAAAEEPPAPEPSKAAPAASPAPPPKATARAIVAPDPAKTYDVVPVFYGTDRAAEPDPKRLQFGSERGHVLQLGRAMITVPLSHKVPHIERPWVVEIPYFKVKIYEQKEDPAQHFTVQEISSLTEDQFLALVRERLAKSQSFKDHAFVFVHGFNTSFDNALYRTAQIAYDLKFDGVPFVYSWPSGGAVASYTYDHGSVEQAEPTLGDFLKLVVQKSGAKSISLIAHSMGNELLLRVLQSLRPQVPDGVVISQVILAAPDVDRDKFNIIAREITNFAKGVTLYAASNDRALGYSARFWGGVPRAGDVPSKGGPLIIPGVDTIDVTAVSTDALGLNHSGYAENPALLDDVKALVEYGLRPPDKRIKGVLTVQTADGTFWRFPTPP